VDDEALDEIDAFRLPVSEREQWILACVLVELEGEDILDYLRSRLLEWFALDDKEEAQRWMDFVHRIQSIIDSASGPLQ